MFAQIGFLCILDTGCFFECRVWGLKLIMYCHSQICLYIATANTTDH